MKTEAIAAICICLLLIVAGCCIYKVCSIKEDYELGITEYEEVKEAAVTAASDSSEDGFLSIDYSALKAANSDFVGWLEIPNTDISYPVVQSVNNDYYLRRTFEGNNNTAGSIFMDYRSNYTFEGINTIIYGHHMKNETMFGSLGSFLDAEYFNAHKAIRLYNESGVYVYKVCSAYIAEADSDCFDVTFGGLIERQRWLDSQLERSAVESDITLNTTDRLLTLVTCVSGKSEERYIIQAVLRTVQ